MAVSQSGAEDSASSASEISSEEFEDHMTSRKRRKISPCAAAVDDEKDHDATLPTIAPLKSRVQLKKPTQQPNGRPDVENSSSPAALTQPSRASFADLAVSPWLVSALHSMAITRPTPIQRACIPKVLQGRDCIGGSRTGSGKTVAFAVPILQKLVEDPTAVYAVVLTPTRELALQLYEQIVALSARQALKCVLVTGGADMRAQAIDLAKRPHIVVATPGRLADHIKTSGEDTICGLRRARFVVLDEADRLLAPGKGSMLPDVESCLSVLPPASQRQTLLFTATVTDEVRALKDQPRSADKPPIFVCELEPARSKSKSTNGDSSSIARDIPPTLTQTYLQAPVTHREAYLHALLSTATNAAPSRHIIIFANRTDTASFLEHLLRRLDHRVTALHSKLPHYLRVGNLARFRARVARILVATDVAARGLDIPHVELVVHYDLPLDPDDYVHRVGRTARAGRSGESVAMMGQRDVDRVLAIEERVGGQMAEWAEEGVSIEGRVVRDYLGLVGAKKREALLAIEEGRDVKGKRKVGVERAKHDAKAAKKNKVGFLDGFYSTES